MKDKNRPMNKSMQVKTIERLLDAKGIASDTVDVESLVGRDEHLYENIQKINENLGSNILKWDDQEDVKNGQELVEHYNDKAYEEMMTKDPPLVHPDLLKAIPDVGLGLGIGDIRSGKSVLGYGLVEHYHENGREVMLLGFPKDQIHLLPEFLRDKVVYSMDDLHEGCFFLVDEAYLQWYSRDSGKKVNKIFDKLAGLCGHRDLLGLLLTQQSAKLEIGGPRASRFIFCKRPSILQHEFERPGMKKITKRALDHFKGMTEEESKHHTYVISHNFGGFIKNSNRPPSFWTEKLSKAWKDYRYEREDQEEPEKVYKTVPLYKSRRSFMTGDEKGAIKCVSCTTDGKIKILGVGAPEFEEVDAETVRARGDIKEVIFRDDGSEIIFDKPKFCKIILTADGKRQLECADKEELKDLKSLVPSEEEEGEVEEPVETAEDQETAEVGPG